MSCKDKRTQKVTTQVNSKSITYPNGAYVCFNIKGNGKKERNFKLGDSISTVLKYLDLNEDSNNLYTFYSLKMPITRKDKFGNTTINAAATFDKNEKLNNFKAFWTYEGDTSKNAHSEFYNSILNNSMGCLWEEGPNIYKPLDTFHVEFFDGHVDEFITDLRTNVWKASFECRLK